MSAAIFALLLPIVLLIGGLWLSAINGWYSWGIALMAFGLLLLIRKIIDFLTSSFHTSHQIDLLHESRTLSNAYGHARLAQEEDGFIRTLAKDIKGFYIGTLGNSPLFYDPFSTGNGHMLTYAPSRTGKTISVIIPALMHWFGGSLFVTDIKGELTKITAKFREMKGQNVLIFNPFDVLGIKGLKFNPLRVLVEDIIHNQGKELHDLARSIAFQLISEKPNDMGDGIFFRNGGRRLILALLLYMAVFKADTCNLPTLRKLVWSSSEEKAVIATQLQESEWFSGLLQDYGNALSDMLAPE